MSSVKWWARLSAAVTGVALTLVVPAHAWAASRGVDGLVIEAVKSPRRRGGLGFLPILGGVCCLVVVGGIILALVLISRNRKRR
ncbi:hypothetical protein [Couchioplanes caeruleus]|uniref:Uncharacterized protein n=1 Tax=Couchioplanes caeruleus TaxID=56438 RepID=A0A3N1GPM6_9ACTN|nr:hypothetical protein [Couchioplanes caeruleus]ROP32185.1 hypothetical protein EDD30_5120 [Couchioplanes caeruleus]